MNEDIITHIFEPFYTTKGPGEGTGLGLATVYGAVRQNNGFIKVSSEPGMGTEFKIHFPRQYKRGETEGLSREANNLPCGNETILLVEDEPTILNMASMFLKSQGYTVLHTSSPIEAVRLARESSGKIHLLITDVVMPEMNGRELAKKLQTIDPDIMILFMSGYTSDVITHHGVLEDGVHFIQKPFSLPDMAVKVREVLER